MRMIVCGGRDFGDVEVASAVLSAFDPAAVTIVHGAARGADTLAANLAHDLGFAVEAHPADWNAHGRSAGPIRNGAMLKAGADLVLAFPGGRGTADMVARARRAGVPVLTVG